MEQHRGRTRERGKTRAEHVADHRPDDLHGADAVKRWWLRPVVQGSEILGVKYLKEVS